MSINANCTQVNGTPICVEPPPDGSSRPVVVGVVSFVVTLLLVGAVVAAVVYVKCRSRLQSRTWRLNTRTHGKPQKPKKADDEQLSGKRAVLHQYSTMGTAAGPDTPGQTPIYENFSSQARNPVVSTGGFEEDLYLQCDPVDDAIYSNDPACNLSMLPEPYEGEDLYIIPDAL